MMRFHLLLVVIVAGCKIVFLCHLDSNTANMCYWVCNVCPCSCLLVEVGYKKWSFRELRAPAHIMKQNVAPSILTPFSSKSAKKWDDATQKTKLDEGSKGGLKITNLCYYLSFVSFFTNVEAYIHVFEVKESIFQGFEKIRPFVFPKMLALSQIKLRGCFCCCARNPFKYWCFVTVEWKIDHSEIHSENLSTLHLFVWPWQPHE